MAIANVELTNTFDDWRTRTNQLIYVNNQNEIAIPGIISSNLQAVAVGANAYANLVWSRSNTYMTATVAGANTAVGAGANAYANLVWSRSNTYMTSTVSGANTFLLNTIAGSNAYWQATMAGANSYWQATIAGANTAVGAGANAFAAATIAGANTIVGTSANLFSQRTIAGANTAVGAGANNYADATFLKINSGTIPSARLSGSYTGITGVGTITTGAWGSTAIPVANGGTGAITASSARTNLGIGTNATRDVYVSASGPSGGNDGDVWYKV